MTIPPIQTIPGQDIFLWVTRLIACVAVLCLPAAGADRDSLLASLQRHFEWGEYDQILLEARPALDSLSETGDSVLLSQLHKYLGVACFAQGRVGEAREEFARAYQCHRGVRLEKDFVSEAMYDLFVNTTAEVRDDLARRDSVSHAQELQARRAQAIKAVVDSLGRHRRSSIAGGVLLSATAAGLAGIAAYQFLEADRHYQIYQDAMDAGDIPASRVQAPLVQRGDAVCVVSGILSGIALAGVVVVFRRVSGLSKSIRRLLPREKRGTAITVSPEGALVVEF